VTLKFLGLSLDQIGKALARPRKEIIRSMRLQAEAVEKEIGRLRRASRTLRETARMAEAGGALDWKKLIKAMEDIQMTEEAKTNGPRISRPTSRRSSRRSAKSTRPR